MSEGKKSKGEGNTFSATTSHTITSLSFDPETSIAPSALNDNAVTSVRCPASDVRNRPSGARTSGPEPTSSLYIKKFEKKAIVRSQKSNR
jgi:hypothetical protein